MDICVNGKSFSSIEEFCEYYDVSTVTVNNKLRKGMSFQEIVADIKFIDICGLLFRSMSEVARYFGVEKNVFNSRLYRGANLEESLISKPFSIKDCTYSSKKGIVYGSRKFNSFKEIAGYFDIPFPLFILKVNETLSITEAISVKDKEYEKGIIKKNFAPRNYYNISYNGKIYTSLKSLCMELGLPYKTISSRVSNGMSLKEALSKEITPRDKTTTLFGKEFPSVKSAYEYYGVSKNDIRYRVQKGMSVEEAILDVKKRKANIINLEL